MICGCVEGIGCCDTSYSAGEVEKQTQLPFQLSSDSSIRKSSALNDIKVTGVRRLAHKDHSSAVVQFTSRICAAKKFVRGAGEGSFAPVMASITEQVGAAFRHPLGDAPGIYGASLERLRGPTGFCAQECELFIRTSWHRED